MSITSPQRPHCLNRGFVLSPFSSPGSYLWILLILSTFPIKGTTQCVALLGCCNSFCFPTQGSFFQGSYIAFYNKYHSNKNKIRKTRQHCGLSDPNLQQAPKTSQKHLPQPKKTLQKHSQQPSKTSQKHSQQAPQPVQQAPQQAPQPPQQALQQEDWLSGWIWALLSTGQAVFSGGLHEEEVDGTYEGVGGAYKEQEGGTFEEEVGRTDKEEVGGTYEEVSGTYEEVGGTYKEEVEEVGRTYEEVGGT